MQQTRQVPGTNQQPKKDFLIGIVYISPLEYRNVGNSRNKVIKTRQKGCCRKEISLLSSEKYRSDFQNIYCSTSNTARAY